MENPLDNRFNHQVLRVLVVDDDEDDFIIIRDLLRDNPHARYQVAWLPVCDDLEEPLLKEDWDAVLVDYDLGAQDGLTLIRKAVQKGLITPMIMVTGRGRYELDVEAIEGGAADYLTKDGLNSALLERVIRHSIDRSKTNEVLNQMVQERTQELQNALEELQVASEELMTQKEELEETEQGGETTMIGQSIPGLFPRIEVLTDASGTILEVNSAAASVFLWSQEVLRGKQLSLFIDLKDSKRFARLIMNLQRVQTPLSGTFHLSKLTKTDGEWLFTGVPMVSGNDPDVSIYWMIHPCFPEEPRE